MNDPAPERITVNFDLAADDYVSYAAAVERRGRSWTSFNMAVALLFTAIPVALLFRLAAAHRMDDPEAIDMAGEFALYAFSLGVIGSWIEMLLVNWLARRRYYATMASTRGPRTAEFDHAGLTLTSKGASATYEWGALENCTFQRGLLLIWIGSFSAVAIPDRYFDSAAARMTALAFVRARLAEARAASKPPTPEPA